MTNEEQALPQDAAVTTPEATETQAPAESATMQSSADLSQQEAEATPDGKLEELAGQIELVASDIPENDACIFVRQGRQMLMAAAVSFRRAAEAPDDNGGYAETD